MSNWEHTLVISVLLSNKEITNTEVFFNYFFPIQEGNSLRWSLCYHLTDLLSPAYSDKPEKKIKTPFQVPPSQRGCETSTLDTHAVAGISPNRSVTENKTPQSAPCHLSNGAGATGRAAGRQRSPPPTWRPSPHRPSREKKKRHFPPAIHSQRR